MMNKVTFNQMMEYLREIEEESLDFLKSIVNTDSYSKNKTGIDNVAHLICKKLENEKIEFETIENENFGNHIIARIHSNTKGGKILLIGHQDTAHPTGTTKKLPFSKEGNLLRGPGISDMKSGLVYMIYASSALKKFFPEDIADIELLFTPDEEIGSPISKNVIKQCAKDAVAVFNLEPARPDGTIVTSRKGSAHLEIEIKGRAAHSGAFIKDGISANDELAVKMVEIKKLSHVENGVTINFGTIKGGVGNNIVSPIANASIHCSFWKINDFHKLYQNIKKIVDHSYIEGTQGTLSGEIGMYPMEENENNQKLYNIVQEAAKTLNLNIIGKTTMGAADSGLTSSMDIPTICGMGPVGGNWHRGDEYMKLDTYLPRLKLFATSLLLCSYSIK